MDGAATEAMGASEGGGDEGEDESGSTGSLPEDPGPLFPYQDLRRLSKYEYENALRTLLPERLLDSLEFALWQIPQDRLGANFDSLAQGVTAPNVLGYFAVAEAVGKNFRQQTATYQKQLVPCLNDGEADEACVASFIDDFGARALRRPLTDDEREQYLELYGVGAEEDDVAGFELVIARFLQAPEFLYKLELGTERLPEFEDRVELTDYELATKLAFYLTGEPPDDALREAVAAGELDDEQLMAHTDRLLADERAMTHVRHFFEQWLVLDQMPDLEMLEAHIRGDTETFRLNIAAADELPALIDHLVWEAEAGYPELMTTRDSFVTQSSLAEIYGIEAWTEEQPHQVLPEHRAGLLTRVIVLANMDGVEHPMMRGKFIRTQLLCTELSLPLPGAVPDDAVEEPELDPNATTRERYEAVTQEGVCQTCHALINPLGFALGDFDGVGRHRAAELIYDAEGELVGELDIDATVEPFIEGSGEDTVTGAAELGALLARHPVAQSCFAQQWFVLQAARPAEPDDAEAIEDLAAVASSDDGGIRGMVRRWVQRPEFRVRRIRGEGD
jgi:hypothetical protein